MSNHKSDLEKQFRKIRDGLQRADGDKVVFNSLMERSEAKRVTWAKEIIDREQARLRENITNSMRGHWKEISEAFESARELARKRLNYLDVNDDRLPKALKLIAVIGPEMTEEKARSINLQFRGSQGALSALKVAYKMAGSKVDGSIDDMTYRHFDSTWNSARNAVLEQLSPEGYLNASGQAVKRLAEFEGIDFDPVINRSEIYDSKQLKTMSTDEINARWGEVSKFLSGTGGGE